MFHGGEIFTETLSTDCTVAGEQSQTGASRASATMLETIRFARLLNGLEEKGKPKLDGLEYTQMLLSLLYRLVESSQYTTWMHRQGHGHDDLTFLGLLAFMTTLLPEYGRDCTSYPLLSNRLDRAIDEFYATIADNQGEELSLLLWVLFISGFSDPAREGRPWLLPLILETCTRLGLDDWSGIRDQLCQYPWISTLHDTPGQCMWEQVQVQAQGQAKNGELDHARGGLEQHVLKQSVYIE